MMETVCNGAAVHQPEELRQKLRLDRPLRVKYGIDPTAAHVHLGHLVGLLKLKQFQDAGHRPVLIIGGFTALVGDPTGRDQTRARLTADQIKVNTEQYLDQISRVLDLDTCEVWNNNFWFEKRTLPRGIDLFAQATVSQILAREDFANRIKKAEPIYLHEILYPLFQGQDSVEVKADVEIGGQDQLFNFMLARDLQRSAGQEPQVCVTVPILRGLDGVKRMGKSLGNYIALEDEPDDMFGKIMSIPDDLIPEWWALLPVDNRKMPEAAPMVQKKALACRIVNFLHGEEASLLANDAWHKRFTLKQDPDDIPVVEVRRGLLADGKMGICPLLKTVGLVQSNTEARKLIAPQYPALGNSGVTVGDDVRKIDDPKTELIVEDGMVLRVGRRRIAKVRLTD